MTEAADKKYRNFLGMKQQVAQALAVRPQVLIPEPFGA